MTSNAIQSNQPIEILPGTRMPLLDRPRSGWPCVVVRAVRAGPASSAAVTLVQSELARWGLASIDGTRYEEAWLQFPDMSPPAIDASLNGYAELTADGVLLSASARGVTTYGFMEVDCSAAATEVAMWFTEHLWGGRAP